MKQRGFYIIIKYITTFGVNEMLLCTDVGNTNIKFAFYDGEKQILKTKVSTDPAKTDDEFAVELYTIIKINGVDKSKIDGSILSSVVPKVTEASKRTCASVPAVKRAVSEAAQG